MFANSAPARLARRTGARFFVGRCSRASESIAIQDQISRSSRCRARTSPTTTSGSDSKHAPAFSRAGFANIRSNGCGRTSAGKITNCRAGRKIDAACRLAARAIRGASRDCGLGGGARASVAVSQLYRGEHFPLLPAFEMLAVMGGPMSVNEGSVMLGSIPKSRLWPRRSGPARPCSVSALARR